MEQPPPPYTAFAEKPTPDITVSDSQPDSENLTSYSALGPGLQPYRRPPPLPPRPDLDEKRPRPVSWNPQPQPSFPADVKSEHGFASPPQVPLPYFAPPPNSKSSPSVELHASLSGPLNQPYMPPTPSSERSYQISAYSPPFPTPRRASYVPPSPADNSRYFDSTHVPSSYNPQHAPPRPTMPEQTYTYPSLNEKSDSAFESAAIPQIPQYQQPYNAATQHAIPADGHPSQQPPSEKDLLGVRASLPPRPVSAPMVPQIGESSAGAQLAHAATVGGSVDQGFNPAVRPTTFVGQDDERKSSYGKRFVSNMLVVRATRATWQSTASTLSLPFWLSPWGDNNPITLPNVRKRDIALAGPAYFGADALLPSDLDVIETTAKWMGKFVLEQAADEAIHHATKDKPLEYVGRAGVTSVTVKVKHKIIGEQAELTLFGERQAENYVDCAKGWFCPYLYASGRAPHLERKKDFGLAQFWSPGLAADAKVAPALLTCTMRSQQSPVIPYCPWETPTPALPHYGRVAVFFLGISPYRTASAWSQARVPGEARLQFHLLSGVPVMVLPAKATTPICAWSSHTVRSLWDNPAIVPNHINEILGFLEHVVDVGGLEPQFQAGWRGSVQATLQDMFGHIGLLRGGHVMLDKAVDMDRAGLVVFRY